MPVAGKTLAALIGDDTDPAALAAVFNAHRSAFDTMIGLVFTSASVEAVTAEVPVTDRLLQPYGLVHGGVYAAIVETLVSAGAALSAMSRGQSTVGLENTTSFLQGTRSGTLHARATPLHRGRRTQVWTVEIHDQDRRLLSTGRVRMLCLESGATVAGETVAIKQDGES